MKLRILLLTCTLASLSITLQAQTQVRFYTTMGNFDVEMSDSLTPITSGNFIDLADSGYYDGVIFHRVMQGFVIQGGDPTGTGSGGPGYTIQDEFDSTGTLSNIQKTLSMANTGQPNSGGSQFFINLVNNTFLDFDKPPLTSKHPVFGVVVDSFEVVLAIGDVAVNAQNRPLTDVVMDSLRILSNDTADTNATDTIWPEGITKLTERDRLKVKVFPNPVGQESVITVDTESDQECVFQMVDQSGRILIEFNHWLRKGMNRITDFGLDETIPAGMYFLKIQGQSAHTTVPLLVTR